jgi:hypothetical protein
MKTYNENKEQTITNKLLFEQADIQKARNNVLSFLEFTDKNIIECSYLIRIASIIGATVEAKDSIFQDHCTFNSNGRCESFADFYKRNITHAIIMQLNKLMIISLGYSDKDEIEQLELYLQELFYTKEHMLFRKFITKKNILYKQVNKILDIYDEYTKEEIIEIYKEYFKDLLEKN